MGRIIFDSLLAYEVRTKNSSHNESELRVQLQKKKNTTLKQNPPTQKNIDQAQSLLNIFPPSIATSLNGD